MDNMGHVISSQAPYIVKYFYQVTQNVWCKIQQYNQLIISKCIHLTFGFFRHCTLEVASPGEPMCIQARLMTASFEVCKRVAYVGFHSTLTNKTSWLTVGCHGKGVWVASLFVFYLFCLKNFIGTGSRQNIYSHSMHAYASLLTVNQ